MENYYYVIVGGGMAAAAAVDGIRELDQKNPILLISSDDVPPYDRPPLSKGLWKDKDTDSIWRDTLDKDVRIKLNTRVTNIDPAAKTVNIEPGESIRYEKLLLATGGTPRSLPFGDEGIIYYRYFRDFKHLHTLAENDERFGVIGSGFIGSEIAAALAMNDREVVIFDTGAGVGWRIFPGEMVAFLNDYYREKGIEVKPNVTVKDIVRDSAGYQVQMEAGEDYQAEVVVAGIGIKPNVELAEKAGLTVSNGIEVDETLQTTAREVYAAGDVANFYNPLLGKRVRVEHADNANAMGKQAGRNMAGAGERYDYLPYFYSDLFDLGYEAVGELDSRFTIIEDWQEKYQKGVLYYLKDERVRGVLLWNVWGRLDEAREAIGLPAPVEPERLKGRIR